jgi:hypothetical protein
METAQLVNVRYPPPPSSGLSPHLQPSQQWLCKSEPIICDVSHLKQGPLLGTSTSPTFPLTWTFSVQLHQHFEWAILYCLGVFPCPF